MSKAINIKKTLVYHDYYSRLKNIAVSIYKWNNLPKSCNARFLEDTLFHYGIAGFCDTPEFGLMNLKLTQSGELNPYNEPIFYTAFSTGYDRVFSTNEIVVVRNNPMEKSTESTIMLYAERLAILEMTIQTNIHAQKTPLLIRCDEKVKRSLEAVYNMYDGDKPVIFGSKSLQEKPIECIITGAPFVADKLRTEKRETWNECLEFLGINTNPSDKKKERLIVSEVDSNNEQIDIQANIFYESRKLACERFKELFKKDISVEMNLEVLERSYQPMKEGEE